MIKPASSIFALFLFLFPFMGFGQTPTILFHETFGNGLIDDSINSIANGVWTTNGTVSGTVDADAIWEYRGPNTTPDTAIGSRGAWSGTQDPINSATTANGFFIFDSDYLDNGGSQTGLGTGTAPAPHQSWLISPSFSTVGYNNVVINFTTYFRRFTGNIYVLLSNDGGVTWGDSITVADSQFGVNNASNSDLTIQNEANHIANTATARMAFYFDGASPDNSANGLGYYFAMIDDITITETPNNNLTFEEYFFQTTNDTGAPSYYSMIPLELAPLDTIQFSGKVSNVGAVTQPNTIIKNTISSPTGTSTLSSLGVNLASGVTDSIGIPTPYVLDQGKGMYSWVFTTNSDSLDYYPANNISDTVYVEVTDTTYARDVNATGNFTYTSGSAYEMGCKYTINDSVECSSISIGVGSASLVGEPVSVYLYNMNNLITPIASHEFVLLLSGDPGAIKSISIPVTTLPPGDYLATYKTYSTNVSFTQSSIEVAPNISFVDVGNTGSFGWVDYLTVVRLNIVPNFTACGNILNLSVVNQISCNGLSDGEAIVNVTQGTAPFTYSWSNGSTASTASSLNAGMHYVTVTDANSCAAVDSIFILDPDTIAIPFVAIQNVTCHGASNGSAIAAPVGGTGTHNYLWSNGGTTSSASGLIGGWHHITVTDANSCVSYDSVFIVNPDPIINTLTAVQNVSCYGGSDGSANAVTIGGTGTYTYLWSSGSTSNPATNLIAGTNHVTITDVNLCSLSDFIYLSEPTQVIVDLGLDTTLCANMSYTLDAGPGFTSYLWSNNSIGQTISINASAGGSNTYSVTVTNVNGCQGTDQVIITGLDPIIVDLGQDTIIRDSLSSVPYILDAGTGFVSYLWSTGETTQTLTVTPPFIGDIFVVVTDAHSCTGSDTVYIEFLIGINELERGHLKIFPNPAENYLFIELSDYPLNEELISSIYDISGKEIKATRASSNGSGFSTKIDVQDLVTGTYILKLDGESIHRVVNFVVK